MAGRGPPGNVGWLPWCRLHHPARLAYGAAGRHRLCEPFRQPTGEPPGVGSNPRRGWFGLLQGLLFLVIIPCLGPVQADEQASAAALILAILVVGAIAGAGLSAFTAAQIERASGRSR